MTRSQICVVTVLFLLDYLVTDGFYISDTAQIIEDDIMIDSKVAAVSMNVDEAAYWKTRQIPFFLDTGIRLDMTIRSTVLSAIYTIENKTEHCVQFQPKSASDADYVNITRSNPGCYSSVGKVGGQQIVNIGPGCETVGIIMHELLHVLGFWHEHSRSDRDQYVVIYYKNIIPGSEAEFVKRSSTLMLEAAIPYDFHSILHYKYNQFAKVKSLDTIVPAPAFSYIDKTLLGQREALSDLDIARIMWLYQCGKYQPNICMPLKLDFGVVSPLSNQYSVGSIVTLQCKTGFLIGTATSQCLGGGKWSNGTPFCVQANQSDFLYCNMEGPCLKLWYPVLISGQLAKWQQHTGASGTAGTGPVNDHTFQNDTGSYLLMDATGVPTGQSALIMSPRITLSGNWNVCLMFWYCMYGSEIGTMSLYVNWQCVWQQSGNTNSTKWEPVVVQYNTAKTSYLLMLFSGTRGNGEMSDLAIDDVFVGPCTELYRYKGLFV